MMDITLTILALEQTGQHDAVPLVGAVVLREREKSERPYNVLKSEIFIIYLSPVSLPEPPGQSMSRWRSW